MHRAKTESQFLSKSFPGGLNPEVSWQPGQMASPGSPLVGAVSTCQLGSPAEECTSMHGAFLELQPGGAMPPGLLRDPGGSTAGGSKWHHGGDTGAWGLQVQIQPAAHFTEGTEKLKLLRLW